MKAIINEEYSLETKNNRAVDTALPFSMKAIFISILVAITFQSNAANLYLGLSTGTNKSFSTGTWTGNFLLQGNYGFNSSLFFGEEIHENFICINYSRIYCQYRLQKDDLLFIINSGNAFDVVSIDFGHTFYTKHRKKHIRFATCAIGFNRWFTAIYLKRYRKLPANGLNQKFVWQYIYDDFEMQKKYGFDLNVCYGLKFRTKKGGYWRTGLSLILNFVELPELGVIWSVNSGPKQFDVYNHFPIQLNYSISRRIFKTNKEF